MSRRFDMKTIRIPQLHHLNQQLPSHPTTTANNTSASSPPPPPPPRGTKTATTSWRQRVDAMKHCARLQPKPMGQWWVYDVCLEDLPTETVDITTRKWVNLPSETDLLLQPLSTKYMFRMENGALYRYTRNLRTLVDYRNKFMRLFRWLRHLIECRVDLNLIAHLCIPLGLTCTWIRHTAAWHTLQVQLDPKIATNAKIPFCIVQFKKKSTPLAVEVVGVSAVVG
jgi:hypothetical protein